MKKLGETQSTELVQVPGQGQALNALILLDNRGQYAAQLFLPMLEMLVKQAGKEPTDAMLKKAANLAADSACHLWNALITKNMTITAPSLCQKEEITHAPSCSQRH